MNHADERVWIGRRMWRWCTVLVHLLWGVAQVAVCFPFLDATGTQRLMRRWSRRLLHLCGVQLRVSGKAPAFADGTGGLLVANHVSWLDIFALLACVDVRFVAKSDIRAWPVLGWVVARSGNLFIDRRNRQHTAQVTGQVNRALAEGKTVAVFPEGTSTDGQMVRPFKSSLFQAAIDSRRPVWPVLIHFPHVDGGCHTALAYYGEMNLWQSLRQVLASRDSRVDVHFLSPLDSESTRSQLAEKAHASISTALHQACGHVADPGVAPQHEAAWGEAFGLPECSHGVQKNGHML